MTGAPGAHFGPFAHRSCFKQIDSEGRKDSRIRVSVVSCVLKAEEFE